MTFREAIAETLRGLPRLAAIHQGRVYPGGRPRGGKPGQRPPGSSLPCTVYSVESDKRGGSLSGPTNISDARVVIEHQSIDPAQVEEMLDATNDHFDGFRGDMEGISVVWVSQDEDVDREERLDDASEDVVYSITTYFNFRYRRP